MKLNKKSVKNLIISIPVISVFLVTLSFMRHMEPIFKSYYNGAELLDMKLGYGTAEVYQLFHVMGEEGRSLYIRHFVIDFAFIISFAFIQYYLLKWVMGNTLLKSKWKYCLSFAMLRGLFDVIENVILLILINQYPIEYHKLAEVSGISTLLKFIMLGLWLITLPVSYIARVRVAKKKYN